MAKLQDLPGKPHQLVSVNFSVNDLPVKINQCSVSLYADDTALYQSSRDSTELNNTLESAFDGVAKLVDNNGLKINSNKTQGMFLGRRGRRNEVKHTLLAHQDDVNC